MTKHICKPKEQDFFGAAQWQCGCGRYFTKKTVKKVMEKYDAYTNKGMFTPGVDPEVTCWHCGSTHLCDCCDATCWKCRAPYAKSRCDEFKFTPTMNKGEKLCRSASVDSSLPVRENLGIVKRSLTNVVRAVFFALNVVRHMLEIVKLRWKKQNQRKEKKMNINDFAKRVTLREGGKVSISIAQVKEVLRIINDLLGGVLYSIIRLMK